MNEEIENGVIEDGSNSFDPSAITQELQEIKKALQEMQPTEEELLEQQKQNEAQQQKALQMEEQYATELETLNSINNNLLTLENVMIEQNELIELQTEKSFEGSFIVVLALVITAAVYMFWNQVTKW